MKILLISTAVAAAPFAAAAAPFLLDDFVSTQTVADRPVGDFPTASETFGPTVLGGFRELSVQTLNPQASVFSTTLSTNFGGEELLNFSNASNQQGIGTLRYDGEGAAGLGGFDATLEGLALGFSFFVENADSDLVIASSITDTAGTTSFLETVLPEDIEGDTVLLGFDGFAGGADLTDVDAIEFVFSGPENLDASFALLGIAQVPLPASGLLLGGALLGVGALRRRT